MLQIASQLGPNILSTDCTVLQIRQSVKKRTACLILRPINGELSSLRGHSAVSAVTHTGFPVQPIQLPLGSWRQHTSNETQDLPQSNLYTLNPGTDMLVATRRHKLRRPNKQLVLTRQQSIEGQSSRR